MIVAYSQCSTNPLGSGTTFRAPLQLGMVSMSLLFLPMTRLFHVQCVLLAGDISRATRKAVDELQAEYTGLLFKIVSVYRRARDDPPSVVPYVRAEFPFEDYPIEALSNVVFSCPSLDAHRFIAAVMGTGEGDKCKVRFSSTLFLTVTPEYNRIPLYWKETSVY